MNFFYYDSKFKINSFFFSVGGGEGGLSGLELVVSFSNNPNLKKIFFFLGGGGGGGDEGLE